MDNTETRSLMQCRHVKAQRSQEMIQPPRLDRVASQNFSHGHVIRQIIKMIDKQLLDFVPLVTWLDRLAFGRNYGCSVAELKIVNAPKIFPLVAVLGHYFGPIRKSDGWLARNGCTVLKSIWHFR